MNFQWNSEEGYLEDELENRYLWNSLFFGLGLHLGTCK